MSVNSQRRTKAEILMFCQQIAGPLELMQKIETNQILAMRRFHMRVSHLLLKRAFSAWNLYHKRLVTRKKRVLKQVELMRNLRSRHNKSNEYGTLVAWTRFVMKQRGERLRETEIELESLRKAIPEDDEMDI